MLYPNALYECAKALNGGADFVYSDEIVLSADLKKLGGYHFKPDFASTTGIIARLRKMNGAAASGRVFCGMITSTQDFNSFRISFYLCRETYFSDDW